LAVLFLCVFSACAGAAGPLTAPKLTNNPSYDIIVTNRRPLFSFFNASGGTGKRTYIIQIDKAPTFDSETIIEYKEVPEENQYITSKLLEEKHTLDEKARHYWRVRAVDETGAKGPWARSRFFLDTQSDNVFMGLVRIPVSTIEVSSGQNPKNIIDLDDPGQSTFWLSSPPGSPTQWVKFNLGKAWEVSRIWMLSNPSSPDGWLRNFVWQMSDDGETWKDIDGTYTENNDTFRNIIDFKPVRTRHLKLLINSWYGYAPQINVITLYSPGKPPVPETPDKDYVLVVGDQMNGYTFTELAEFIEGLDLDLETLSVPHYEVSLEMVNNLKKKPVAIVLSGNNAGYQNLPMFEYNGNYELIRKCEIPIIGICCGHQLTVMAYGYTYARSMGWEDITSLDLEEYRKMTPIMIPMNIKKKDPVFKGIPDPFTAVEIHGWAVAHLPEDYEVLATSTYIQALKSNSKFLYGEQFHAEIKVPYNQGTPYLVNFLTMAVKKARR